MDCQHARLLLHFVRPGEPLLAPDEMGTLHEHLAQCPDCRALSQSERRADELLARAMKDVPVPAQLRVELLDRLAQKRRPGPWTWSAIAASLLFVAGLGVTWSLWPAPELDLAALAVSKAGESPENVRAWFHDQGLAIEVPSDFDYRHLDGYEVILLQGRHVAKLTFRRHGSGNNHDAVAHVYVVPAGQFSFDEERSHAVVVHPNSSFPGFVFLVTHAGGTLDRFLLGGI